MTTRVQTLIDAAQKLSLLEQLELISTISQSIHRNYQQTQPTVDFWEPKTLEQHVQAQLTRPVTDIADLVADFWPEEESADDFIAYIYQQRREDCLRA
jgi:hypothetical protein